MLIYLDTNIYCRPFDDQNQNRIARETEAFGEIYDRIAKGEFVLVYSGVLLYEFSLIKDLDIRKKVSNMTSIASIFVKVHPQLKKLYKEIIDEANLQPRDALHLASATVAQTKVFITCDDKVVNKEGEIQKIEACKDIIIVNPIEFLEGLK